MTDHMSCDIQASSSSSSVRFLSWNVKGLNNPVKRSKIFSHLKRLNPDIVFLQETHLQDTHHCKLRYSWVGETFHSTFNSKARGVAILISKKVDFMVSKTIEDKNGRFLIIAGKLFHTPVLLVNIYAPNFDNPDFTNNLFSTLPFLDTHCLILAGDLNCVMNPTLDRSSPRVFTQSSMSKSISDFMSQNGFVDPWRTRNPQTKKFSFFSQVHQSYSRIDYFFVDGSLMPKVTSSEYHPVVISDHAPLSLDINFTGRPRSCPSWRFNTLLLSADSFNQFILSAIDDFLAFNKSDSVSSSLLWETLKAYLRGHIISYSANLNKNSRAKVAEISAKIQDVDNQNAINPSQMLLKQRQDLQTELDLLTTADAERLLIQSRATYYEHGEKPSRLLAHQLKRRASSRTISQVKDQSGNLVSDPVSVSGIFKRFYCNLYSSESQSVSDEMLAFLQNSDLSTINKSVSDELDAPIKIEEIFGSIKCMQSRKAPGSDGFPAEFFKKFKDKLAPLLLDVYNESLRNGRLPPTLTQASISVLLKKGKDPTACESYRPLSLLNVDFKILAKLLAIRLEAVLPQIISQEQNGFIKGRQLFFNTRTVLSTIFSAHCPSSPEVIISLDAEKAFDRVEWDYLFAVLTRFGFGERFVSWIKLLYTSPQACVITNSVRSDYFPLCRGTRQGCPLSPLLFALAVEPLSVALKSLSSFHGIIRAGVELKVSLYADDLLLYVADPICSLPPILSVLEKFSSFSGYKINLLKSECYPVNSLALTLEQSDIPFKLSPLGFRYLGINITRTLPLLFSENFAPLVSQFALDFQRWNSLPLPLIGRINIIKMNVLPRFLFLCQCIPLFLPKQFFKSLDQMVSSFLWNGRAPRLRLSLLQQFTSNGGLSLPNFLMYYWSSHIHKLTYWLNSPNLIWCKLEIQSISPYFSPASLIYSSLPVKTSSVASNPIVLSTLKIWFQFRSHFKFISPSTRLPLLRNHLFSPATTNTAYLTWHERGIKTMSALYKGDVFLSFSELSSKFNLPPTHLFLYLQIRHCVSSLFPNFPILPADPPWVDLLLVRPNQKSPLSNIYCMLMATESDLSGKIRIAWERELGVELFESWWDKVNLIMRSSTPCARLQLIQFKVINRVHFSKSRISKIFPSIIDQCDRCHTSPCNLSHMFFFCPSLNKFWSDFFSVLSGVLEFRSEKTL
uniref:Reverse transcriptase domain-containing protein n=1 Tax=Oreochromis niloticus TaxID=8128 RepID=A0A669BRS1_ORENI